MSNSNQVTLSGTQWKSFLKILQGLSKCCNDVEINDGFIRQRANDGSAIFEIDMTPILGDSSFPIDNIKEKLGLLKELSGQVTIEADLQLVVFSDIVSSTKLPIMDKQYLDNRYMSKQYLDALIQNILQDDNLLANHKIEKKNLKRIRNAIKTFKAINFQVIFDNHSASIRVAKYGGYKGINLCVDIIRDIPLLQSITGQMNQVVYPYNSFAYDGDIAWEMYRRDDKVINKNYGSIGELTETTYTRGDLKNDLPERPPQPEETPDKELETPEIES